MPLRRQLSLFVPPPHRADLDDIRRITDPVQHRLIPAHVTLCREDELGELHLRDVETRLEHARSGPVTLEFGPPERFGGHGILLPCIGGAEAFHTLREVVLATRPVRTHTPHLTLAHPRNPKAPGNDLAQVAALQQGLRVTFPEVSYIEQLDGYPWQVLGAALLASG